MSAEAGDERTDRPHVPEPPAEVAVPTDRAVVDRIVDGTTAVLLVGPGETELIVRAGDLPDGATEGSWVVLGGEPPRPVALDGDRTTARRAAVDERLARLRHQRGGRRFGHRE